MCSTWDADEVCVGGGKKVREGRLVSYVGGRSIGKVAVWLDQ